MLASQIKTASDLKGFVESRDTESHFFDRKSMRFFGDTMRNYGVRKIKIVSNYDANGEYVAGGVEVEVYELYRRKPVKHGVQKSAYFHSETFQQVYPKE
jgi:hypothetical protein